MKTTRSINLRLLVALGMTGTVAACLLASQAHTQQTSSKHPSALPLSLRSSQTLRPSVPGQVPPAPGPGAALPTGEKMVGKDIKHGEEPNRWIGGRLLCLWRGDPTRREIALTFDDGPHPSFTPRLLDLLRQLNVKVTFFLVGKKVDLAPALVARMHQEGHEVANHTYHHVNLDRIPDDLLENEIRLGNDAVRRACGVTPVCFRPPGGHHKENVCRAAEKQKMTMIMWTDDPFDFARPGEDVLETRLMSKVSNGGIILLHDGIEQTLNILPDLVARLRRDGYRFVTASELAQHVEKAKSGRK